jgi:hypothetical protein
MHSAGFTAWRQRHPKAQVEPRKARKVFRQLAAERSFDVSARYIDYSCDMVGYAIRAVQRSIHLGDKGESTMQQLGETCESVWLQDSGAAKSLNLCRATKSRAGCHAVVRSVPRHAQ